MNKFRDLGKEFTEGSDALEKVKKLSRVVHANPTPKYRPAKRQARGNKRR